MAQRLLHPVGRCGPRMSPRCLNPACPALWIGSQHPISLPNGAGIQPAPLNPYGPALTGAHTICTRRPGSGPPAGGHFVTCLSALVFAGRSQEASCGGSKQHTDSRFYIPDGSSRVGG